MPQNGIDQRLLPDKPKLAPGVKLAGQMQESAFENPPWLLEREDAGYVQVTELLYRIAEQCSGANTVEQIAANLSGAGRPVNPNTVRALIAQLLIPRGLVERADGTVVPIGGAISPLALNMRMKMIGPEMIKPVTNVLRILYWPPIMVAVLVVAAVAQGWLYFSHGVSGALRDAIYTPRLMPVILLVIIISAAFHELGHAAALHYAGGKIKSMGAGIYVVYPAFYTDVSDNYRLPRWKRVRTDLGGFYFNLIFALGIMGLYAATGQEFLLLLVLLINLEIIHQLLPFLRLDGYWTLADITGIPDFFSQMGAFARSVLPVSGWKGRKLPPLKWWGKLVFAVYTLITVPLLLLLLVLMLRSVPRVLATAWDSLGQQGLGFVEAQSHADILGILAAAAQAFLLLIPTVGLCYTLFTLGRRLSVFMWRWSEPSAKRRMVTGVCYVAAAGLVGFMWLPQLPQPGQPTPPAPVSVGPLSSVSWQPLAADDRGTIQDAVSDAVAGPAVRPTIQPTPATRLPGASTPQSTPIATQTAGVVATAAAVVPGVQVTPTAGVQAADQSARGQNGTPSATVTATVLARRTPTALP